MARSGFTLIELLIVVAILGVIAGIALPAYFGQIAGVRQASLDANLSVIRKAIEIYAADHGGVWPGYPDGDLGAAPSENAFLNQLMLRTSRDGSVDPGGSCGPYLRREAGFPRNPLSDRNRVAVYAAAAPQDPGEEYGWIYIAATGEFFAVDEDGGGAQDEGAEDALTPEAIPAGGARESAGARA